MNQIPIEKKVLNENQKIAAELREKFREHKILVVNIISSPGSGKTTLLERTLERLGQRSDAKSKRVVVLTGDLQTENDARRLAQWGFPVKQIITGGTCHLDAKMIERHIADWPLDSFDLLIIENVGNLVCPSSYDLGEHCKIVMLSVTEGEDKPLKYPSIFVKSELMLLSKVDLLPYVPFSAELAKSNARTVHPGIRIIETAGVAGAAREDGLEEWMRWLEEKLVAVKSGELVSAE